jgi:RNA polymerase-binding transcription factor DksA
MKKAKSVKTAKKTAKKVVKSSKPAKKSKPSKAAKPSKKAKPVKAKKAPVKKSKPVKSKAPKATKKAIKKVVKKVVKKVIAKKVVKVSKPIGAKKEKLKPVKPIIKTKVETRMKEIPKKESISKTTEQLPERARYKDSELKEFKDLLLHKLEDARKELGNLQSAILNANEHGTDDTASTFKVLEDGSDTLAKEEASQLAQRQRKFIEQLENALLRIENKTYGICRVTGKLIPKERLRAVPHTTQSMEAKMKQYND